MPHIDLAQQSTSDTILTRVTPVGSNADAAAQNSQSVFGRIKWLTDGISGLLNGYTTARAQRLDNLDATVSSRAPAQTALSNTVWTNARAQNLDNLTNINNSVTAIARQPGNSSYATRRKQP
jgi:hypothetical protein